MARPLRIEFEGAFYHVTSRGNHREEIYFSNNDCYKFIDQLAETCIRYNLKIHAYCLMPNHYHLLVETPDGNLSQGMHKLNTCYTQYINRKQSRSGHLFQGRFKSILVDTDRYYKTLLRYVLQNPVRAGMVQNAESYYWSSYNATVGKHKAEPWLVIPEVLAHFSRAQSPSLTPPDPTPEAIATFKQFLQDKDPEPIWSSLTDQIFLGDRDFARKQKEKLPSNGVRHGA
jgi:putative transposase